jgi:aminoglycoside phosphotransferase (APT) family kinase protein
VDVTREKAVKKLYVRGARQGDWPPMPLEYEGKVFKVFEESGLRVPHVYGYIADIPAVVMDLAPGRTSLATAANEADRDAVRAQLIEQMILMHRVNPSLMKAAGAPRPEDDAEAGLTYYRLIEKLFVDNRVAPAPAIEFIRLWLNRYVPDNPDGARPVAVDAAQFLFEGNRLTAMLDFEFAGLGDYHTDLAALRIRNRAEFLGDPNELIDQYARSSGMAVDLHRIRYHTAMIAILTPLQVARELAHPSPAIDYHEYVIWNAFCILIALDCITEIKGLEPVPFDPPGEGKPSRHGISADALAQTLSGQTTGDEYLQYQRKKQALVLRFLSRADAHRARCDDEYLDDAAQLLGRRPQSWAEADRDLERLVVETGEAHEKELLRVFTRRYLNECFLLADPLDQINYEQLTTRMVPLKSV